MPVKLAVCSDLHADTTLANDLLPRLVAEYVAKQGVDALLICGDLSAQKQRFQIALRELRRCGCPIGFVPGNQDVWLLAEESQQWDDSWSKLDWIVETCTTSGVNFLGDWLVNDEVLVVGTIGWYDYSFASPDLQNVIGLRSYEEKYLPGITWMDGLYVKWGVPDQDVCNAFNNEMNDRLSFYSSNSPPEFPVREKLGAHRATVVATHIVPFVEGVTYKGDFRWDFSCAYMGSKDLGDIILQQAVDTKISNVVFGHSHVGKHFGMGGVRCTCAPFGFFPKVDPDEAIMRQIVERTVQIIEV